MKQQLYRIFLEATVKPGLRREQVAEHLAKIFKKDVQIMEQLLTGKSKVIRSSLSLEEASKYKKVLEGAGAVVYIEPQEESSDSGLETSKEPAPRQTERSVVSPPPRVPPAVEPKTRSTSLQRPVPRTKTPTGAVTGDLLKTPGSVDDMDDSDERMGGVDPTPTPLAEKPQQESNAASESICPKCGYTATTPTDVLLVRGDCPRCGLRVRRDSFFEDETDTEEADNRRKKARPEVIYADHTPASWDRRTAASLHSLGMFAAIYSGLACLLIFALVPVVSLPSHLSTSFAFTALQDFPIFLISVAVFTAYFIIPAFNEGRTWGQRSVGIGVLGSAEVQVGGFYAVLVLKVLVAFMMTFGPAWLILWLGGFMGWFESPQSSTAAIVVSAIVTWIGCALYAYGRPDRRNVFDLMCGTLQVEEGAFPENAYGKAFARLAGLAGFWVFFGWLLPFVVKRF